MPLYNFILVYFQIENVKCPEAKRFEGPPIMTSPSATVIHQYIQFLKTVSYLVETSLLLSWKPSSRWAPFCRVARTKEEPGSYATTRWQGLLGFHSSVGLILCLIDRALNLQLSDTSPRGKVARNEVRSVLGWTSFSYRYSADNIATFENINDSFQLLNYWPGTAVEHCRWINF